MLWPVSRTFLADPWGSCLFVTKKCTRKRPGLGTLSIPSTSGSHTFETDSIEMTASHFGEKAMLTLAGHHGYPLTRARTMSPVAYLPLPAIDSSSALWRPEETWDSRGCLSVCALVRVCATGGMEPSHIRALPAPDPIVFWPAETPPALLFRFGMSAVRFVFSAGLPVRYELVR